MAPDDLPAAPAAQAGRPVYFVTGATGFLGRHVVKALRAHEPRALIRALVRRPGIQVDGIDEPVIGALSDEAALRHGVADCEAVLHFAGATHAHHPDVYQQVNEQGTAQLVRAAEQAEVRRFVFASSRAIGESCGSYGASKARAEAVITTSRLPYVILRFAEVYGPGSTEGIGSLVNLVRRLPIVPMVRGARLAPVHIEDVVDVVLASLESEAAVGQTYTIAGPRAYSFDECVQEIAEALGVRRLCLPVPVGAVRTMALISRLLGRQGLTKDQVERLVCAKDESIEPAMRGLAFRPRRFEDGLRSVVG